jgi:hypothetical protein
MPEYSFFSLQKLSRIRIKFFGWPVPPGPRTQSTPRWTSGPPQFQVSVAAHAPSKTARTRCEQVDQYTQAARGLHSIRMLRDLSQTRWGPAHLTRQLVDSWQLECRGFLRYGGVYDVGISPMAEYKLDIVVLRIWVRNSVFFDIRIHLRCWLQYWASIL